MAATQMAEYSSHHQRPWVPARAFRFHPYATVQSRPYVGPPPTTEQPVSGMQSLPMPTTSSPPHHGGNGHLYQNGEENINGEAQHHQRHQQHHHAAPSPSEPPMYIQPPYHSAQPTPTVLTSPFDPVPSIPASQPVVEGAPLLQDAEPQDDQSTKDESAGESHSQSQTMSVSSIPRSLEASSGHIPPGMNRPVRPNDIFERVQGRFSLLGSSNKYNVTVGEIKRRINPPECLNTSLLGGLLRRGKGKNGGNDLRQKLEACGLVLPPGRRKATSVSMLTSLVEAEAQDLALQFAKVCQAIFPATELSRNVAQAKAPFLESRGRREEEQRGIRSAIRLVSELRELLEHYLAQEEKERDLPDPPPMTGLRSFSLITHGFGVPTISGVLSVLQTYLSGLVKYTADPHGHESVYHQVHPHSHPHATFHYPQQHPHQQ